MFIDDFPFSDNLKVILNTFYLSHTVWFSKNLENTWLTSTLSALRLTFENDEIILKLAQASAMLGELGLKTDESQQGDEEHCEKTDQRGTTNVKRLRPVLVNMRVNNVITESNFCIYFQVRNVEACSLDDNAQYTIDWQEIHL